MPLSSNRWLAYTSEFLITKAENQIILEWGACFLMPNYKAAIANGLRQKA